MLCLLSKLRAALGRRRKLAALKSQLTSAAKVGPTPDSRVAERRVVVLGGLSLVRATRCSVLAESGLRVVSNTPSSAEAVESAEAFGAALAIVDMSVSGGCVPAVRMLVDRLPGIAILVVAPSLDPRVLLAVVRAGANGLVTEAASAPGFARAVTAALAGEAVIPREGVATLIEHVRALAQRAAPNGHEETGLTRRESQVLALLRDGLTPKQVAFELQVSAVTVRRHRAGSRKAAAARQTDTRAAAI